MPKTPVQKQWSSSSIIFGCLMWLLSLVATIAWSMLFYVVFVELHSNYAHELRGSHKQNFEQMFSYLNAVPSLLDKEDVQNVLIAVMTDKDGNEDFKTQALEVLTLYGVYSQELGEWLQQPPNFLSTNLVTARFNALVKYANRDSSLLPVVLDGLRQSMGCQLDPLSSHAGSYQVVSHSAIVSALGSLATSEHTDILLPWLEEFLGTGVGSSSCTKAAETSIRMVALRSWLQLCRGNCQSYDISLKEGLLLDNLDFSSPDLVSWTDSDFSTVVQLIPESLPGYLASLVEKNEENVTRVPFLRLVRMLPEAVQRKQFDRLVLPALKQGLLLPTDPERALIALGYYFDRSHTDEFVVLMPDIAKKLNSFAATSALVNIIDRSSLMHSAKVELLEEIFDVSSIDLRMWLSMTFISSPTVEADVLLHSRVSAFMLESLDDLSRQERALQVLSTGPFDDSVVVKRLMRILREAELSTTSRISLYRALGNSSTVDNEVFAELLSRLDFGEDPGVSQVLIESLGRINSSGTSEVLDNILVPQVLEKLEGSDLGDEMWNRVETLLLAMPGSVLEKHLDRLIAFSRNHRTPRLVKVLAQISSPKAAKYLRDEVSKLLVDSYRPAKYKTSGSELVLRKYMENHLLFNIVILLAILALQVGSYCTKNRFRRYGLNLVVTLLMGLVLGAELYKYSIRL